MALTYIPLIQQSEQETLNLLQQPLYRYRDIYPTWNINNDSSGDTYPQYIHFYTDACRILKWGNYSSQNNSTWQGPNPYDDTVHTLDEHIVLNNYNNRPCTSDKGLSFISDAKYLFGSSSPWSQISDIVDLKWWMYNIKYSSDSYTGKRASPNVSGGSYSNGLGNLPWIEINTSTSSPWNNNYTYCLVTYCSARFMESASTKPYTIFIQSILYTPFNLYYASDGYYDDSVQKNIIYIPYCFANIHRFNTTTYNHNYPIFDLRIWGKFIGKVDVVNNNNTLNFTNHTTTTQIERINVTGNPPHRPCMLVTGTKVKTEIGASFNQFKQANVNTRSGVCYLEETSGASYTYGDVRDPLVLDFGKFTGPDNTGGSGTKVYQIKLIPYWLCGYNGGAIVNDY